MDTYRTNQAAPLRTTTSLNPWSVPVQSQNLACPFSEDQLNNLAIVAAERQHFSQALSFLNELIAKHPQEAKYYSNRGLVYLQEKQYQRSLADFNRALTLSSNLDQTFNNRANCYAAMGYLRKALADYTRAIDLNPLNIKARVNIAVTLRQLGCYDEALTNLEEALTFHQRLGQIYGHIGRTYHLRGDWNAAIAHYQKALYIMSGEVSQQEQPLRQRIIDWCEQLTSLNRN